MKNNTIRFGLASFAVLIMIMLIFCFTGTAYADEGDDISSDTITVDNGLPVLYINIDETTEGNNTIDQMNESEKHTVHCAGTATLEVPDGFRYSDMPDDAVCEGFEDMVIDIRGRGNSTWSCDKKPYKIKLDKKTNVFGLGKNKHWVLLAGAYDKTLVRNRLTAWLSNRIGFDFTPTGYPVDLVMSGDVFGTRYLGSYYLCENVRVDDNRLEIDELDKTVTDPDSLEITGGYLLQKSVQTPSDSKDIFYTVHGEDWATYAPCFDTRYDDDAYECDAQQQYIQNYIQLIDDALFDTDYMTADGRSYRDLMDLDSAAKYWLVNQVALNGDSYRTGSTYIYKTRDTADTPGKVYWGPIWDFDFAWDYEPDIESLGYADEWTNAMLRDTDEGGFVEKILNYWPEYRTYLLEAVEDGGLLDGYFEETERSAEADRIMYPPEAPWDWDEETDGEYVAPPYKDDIEFLKDWIIRRVEWMDEHIDDLNNYMHRLTFVVDDKVIYTTFVQDGGYISGTTSYPDKEGMTFTGWFDENGVSIKDEDRAYSDVTYHAVYIPEEEATHGQDIALSRYEDVIQFEPEFPYYNIPYIVVPTDAQYTKAEWTSSDESIATVNNEGLVTYYKTGTVTFTGKLKYGNSRVFTLTITDDKPPVADQIKPETQVYYMVPGEERWITILTEPSPGQTGYSLYTAQDPEIVDFPYTNVFQAKAPGETRIDVEMVLYDDDEEGNYVIVKEFETYVIVKVFSSSEVRDVMAMINALPGDITSEDEAQIEEAMAAYKALSDEEKSQLPDSAAARLYAADARINAIIAKAERAAADQSAKEAATTLKKINAKNRTVKGLKVTSKNGKITVKYNKNANASGYQIQYKLKSAKKYKNLKSATTKLKVTSKKLKKGKTYCVRVRTYNKIDGKKVYGKWSNVKKIKVK